MQFHGVRVRSDFNSTRNGNREAEIILSSREGFPRVICVRSLFRIVREDWSVSTAAAARRAFRACKPPTLGGSFIGVRFNSEALAFILCFPSVARTSPPTCWSFVINCLHDIPIVEQFVALLPRRKLRFLKPLEFICRSIVNVMLFVWLLYSLQALQVIVAWSALVYRIMRNVKEVVSRLGNLC